MTDDSPAERLAAFREEHDLPPATGEELAAITEAVEALERQRAEIAEELQRTNQGLMELTAELQDAEQRYRRLFETSAEGIYTISPDLQQYQLVNPALSEIFGYDSETALLEAVTEVATDVFVSQARYEEYRSQLSEVGRLDGFEYQIETPTDDRRWVSDSVVPITDDDGSLQGYRGGVIDITERKRRETELRQFRQATEAAGHAIFLVDPDGTITYVNPAFEAITGYTTEEACGQTPSILTSEEADAGYERFWETIPSDGKWEGRIVCQRKSGEYYHTRQTIAPITDESGAIQKFVGIQTDITRQVERERQVNALDRVLRHNLRNNLNVIKGHAEMAAQETTDETVETAIAEIIATADQLMKTADEGREITRLLATRAQRDVRPIDSLVREVVTAMETRYPEATIETEIADRAAAVAVDSIDRAIEELLDNAIRHNDDSPHVEVTVETTDAEVCLRVADNGPGIPEFDTHVFEDPERGDELSHGSGLGLWLIYWIVRRSGGSLEYDDRPGGGSVITLWLPRAHRTELLHSGQP